MATHSMYCVGLKRKVDATVDGVTHMVTSKGSKYQIKGHFVEGGKTHNCTSMCSKAVYEDMKDAGISASVKDRTVILDAEPKLGSGKRFKELSDEIAEEYEEKGKSPEEAQAIGDATAASIGIKKYGKKKMAKLAHHAEGDEVVPEDSEGDGVETPEEVTDIEEEADVEQPEVDDAYTEESGEEIAPSVVESSSVSATADAPEGSEPLSYDPTAETPMDDGGPAASFSADHESAFDKLEDEVADQYEDKGMDDEEAHDIGAKVAYDAGVKKYGKRVMEEAARKGVPAHTLVAESAFDKLEDEIADEYEDKGMSDEEADRIGAATAYKIGVEKYGKAKMEEAAREGVPADSLDAEGLHPQTAFGGDLASLEDFDGVESVVVEAPLGHGVTQYYAEEDGVVADPSTFPAGSGHVIGSQTATANYTPLHAEDETSPDYDPLSETPGPHLDESEPSDSFEAMAVYQSGPGDVNKGMAALISKSPYTIARGNFLAWGPKYLTVKEGVTHNKYHLFVVFKLDNGMYMPANAYGRIGYSARTWFGPAMSSEGGAIREAEKKMRLKEHKKGYNLEFGAEAGDAPEESHPTDYDPLTASPTDEGGPAASFGWSEEDADAGAFSAEFIANAEELYCAECFKQSCTDHQYDAEDGPSPLDYDPLTEAPSGEGGPPAGPSDHFEAESNLNMAAGVGLVVGLIAAYKYSDKISDLFRKLGDE